MSGKKTRVTTGKYHIIAPDDLFPLNIGQGIMSALFKSRIENQNPEPNNNILKKPGTPAARGGVEGQSPSPPEAMSQHLNLDI